MNDWTIRSAAPVACSMVRCNYNTCLTPFILRKCRNSSLLNCGPLSLTNFGLVCPYLREQVPQHSDGCTRGVLFIMMISGHFEWASTMTRKSCLSNCTPGVVCSGFLRILAGRIGRLLCSNFVVSLPLYCRLCIQCIARVL